jgi:hypothetical protein
VALRYKDFIDKVDLDAVYTEIEWEPLYTKPAKDGGTEDIGYCPDPWNQHKNGDTTGKFAIHRDKRVANCWVCGGSSLLGLVAAIKNIEFEAALDLLYGYATHDDQGDDEFRNEVLGLLAQLDAKRDEDTIPYFNPLVLNKWKNDNCLKGLQLWNEGEFDGKPKHIRPDVLEANALFAFDAVKFAPRSKTDGKPIDENYQGPCIIFPHYWKGRLVGWQHRWLADDRPKWVSKYTNTPDFPKAVTLYGVPRPSPLPVVVVESVPTRLVVESLGWPSVGTFGASVTPEQLKLLRRFQQGVIIAPDNDKPGLEALVKMADYLEGFIPVSYIEPVGRKGKGDDLGDIPPDQAREALHGAERIS